MKFLRSFTAIITNIILYILFWLSVWAIILTIWFGIGIVVLNYAGLGAWASSNPPFNYLVGFAFGALAYIMLIFGHMIVLETFESWVLEQLNNLTKKIEG